MMRIVLWSVTVARIALVPVFVAFALRAQELSRAEQDVANLRWIVIAVLAAIGISDMLDGWLARRFDLATQVGAVADAAADKLAQVTLAALFTFSRGPAFAPLPVWFLGLVLGRDVVLAAGWLVLRATRDHIHVVHRPHGKASSVLLFGVLLWITLGLPAGTALTLLVVATSALIAASTAAYALDGIRQTR